MLTFHYIYFYFVLSSNYISGGFNLPFLPWQATPTNSIALTNGYKTIFGNIVYLLVVIIILSSLAPTLTWVIKLFYHCFVNLVWGSFNKKTQTTGSQPTYRPRKPSQIPGTTNNQTSLLKRAPIRPGTYTPRYPVSPDRPGG
ncbi:hypothetical protein V8F33_009165 [Rhypophila sp. PSN 637]